MYSDPIYLPMVQMMPVFLTMCGLEKTSSRDTCSMRVLADCASWWGTENPSAVESVEKCRPRFPIHLVSISGTSSRATVVPEVGENTSSLSLPLTDPDILTNLRRVQLASSSSRTGLGMYSTCRCSVRCTA